MKNSVSILLILVVIGLSTLACSLVGGSNEKSPTTPALNENENSAPAVTENMNPNLNGNSSEESNNTNSDDDQNENFNSNPMNTEFPIPGNAKIIQSNPNLLMASADMPIKDIIAFYREELGKQGMTEYELLTSVTDTTFSLVFRGEANENELIIQGTDIGNNSVAFSLRYEDVD